MFLGAIPCWIKKSSFFCKLSTYMQASLIIYVCSETLMLLALQHRKLRHHFYIITLDIFALSFFSYLSTAIASWIPSTQGMLHSVTASLPHPFLRVKRHLPAWHILLPCSQLQQKIADPRGSFSKMRPSSSPPQPRNTAHSREVTCVFGDTGGKPSTSVLTLLRLLITGLTVLLTADSLLCLL